jgi:hypothetical protein
LSDCPSPNVRSDRKLLPGSAEANAAPASRSLETRQSPSGQLPPFDCLAGDVRKWSFAEVAGTLSSLARWERAGRGGGPIPRRGCGRIAVQGRVHRVFGANPGLGRPQPAPLAIRDARQSGAIARAPAASRDKRNYQAYRSRNPLTTPIAGVALIHAAAETRPATRAAGACRRAGKRGRGGRNGG